MDRDPTRIAPTSVKGMRGPCVLGSSTRPGVKRPREGELRQLTAIRAKLDRMRASAQKL